MREIGAALRVAIDTYIHFVRGTGRTTRMMDMVKTGDRIIVPHPSMRHHIIWECKKRGIDATCRYIDPKNPGSLADLPPVYPAKTWVDHTWIEQFYAAEIDSIDEHLREIIGRLNRG